jgi:2-C-methyl-D-erythritol 2,4-cyclodiphosphate synthase
VGIGYDVHGLSAGRKLVLGGVDVPSPQGLVGHSDADVLTHAVIDALLGALGVGDIGRHFPDTDERYRDARSVSLLEDVLDRFLKPEGWEIGNVDSTILAESPRLAPHIDSIRDSLARTLRIPLTRTSVKATTMEGFDAVGREEAIAAHAVVLILR